MPSGRDFAMIANYLKKIESRDELLVEEPTHSMDQQVPDSEITMTLNNIKTEVKKEQTQQPNYCSLADVFMDNFSYGSNIAPLTDVSYQLDDFNRQSFLTSQPDHVLTNLKDFSQTSVSSVSSALSGMCSLMSSTPSNTVPSQPLQMMSHSISSSVSLCSSQPTFKPAVTKTRTFVTGLAGSGGTVTTNSNIFSEDVKHSLLNDHLQEEVEYTDLDKAVSFYDDFDSKTPLHSNILKPVQMQEDENSLEDAIHFIIKQDSENLNIPHDPQLWTSDHVNRWVGWVCQKNGQCDLTREIAAFNNGHTLCSWSYDDFTYHFGSTGHFLFNELELWKAANTYFPNHQNKSPLADPNCQAMMAPQNNFARDGNTLSFSPASSPALSSCSSPESDNSNRILSQSLDLTDDDSAFYPEVKPSTNPDSTDSCKIFHKRVPGRGHKKSIALWQFLRKLLLSDQNYGCIRWIDRKAGIFKIEDSKKVANLWGAEKNRPAMNYDKLSRSVRQYYKKGIIKKPEQSKRLLYQFCPEYL